MISITEIEPGIDQPTLQMVAELLACIDPDPERRSQHREEKLSALDQEQRIRVLSITNRVILARGSNHEKIGR